MEEVSVGPCLAGHGAVPVGADGELLGQCGENRDALWGHAPHDVGPDLGGHLVGWGVVDPPLGLHQPPRQSPSQRGADHEPRRAAASDKAPRCRCRRGHHRQAEDPQAPPVDDGPLVVPARLAHVGGDESVHPRPSANAQVELLHRRLVGMRRIDGERVGGVGAHTRRRRAGICRVPAVRVLAGAETGKGLVRMVEEAQHVVERAVLEHQHHYVLDPPTGIRHSGPPEGLGATWWRSSRSCSGWCNRTTRCGKGMVIPAAGDSSTPSTASTASSSTRWTVSRGLA